MHISVHCPSSDHSPMRNSKRHYECQFFTVNWSLSCLCNTMSVRMLSAPPSQQTYWHHKNSATIIIITSTSSSSFAFWNGTPGSCCCCCCWLASSSRLSPGLWPITNNTLYRVHTALLITATLIPKQSRHFNKHGLGQQMKLTLWLNA